MAVGVIRVITSLGMKMLKNCDVSLGLTECCTLPIFLNNNLKNKTNKKKQPRRQKI